MGSPNLENFWLIFKKSPFHYILENFSQNGAMFKTHRIISWGRSLRNWSFSAQIKQNLRGQNHKKWGPQIWNFFSKFSAKVHFCQFWTISVKMGPCWKLVEFFREVGPYLFGRFRPKLSKIWWAKITKNRVPKFGKFLANFQERSISLHFGEFRTKLGHVEKPSYYFVRSVLTNLVDFGLN